jgi:signal transduction histidine kinase/DNA-binding response OmpR family regulator
LPGNIVGCFQEYEDEGMLIGFYDYKFSLRKYNGEVMNYIHEPEKGPHFTPWSVRAIERGPGGNFWIGSTTGGIAKFCPEKNSFRIFRPSSEKDSMPASWVQNILFDGEDQAWLASKTSGLIHLNMEDMKFKSFKIQGLQEDNQPQITSLCEWKVNEDYILVGTLKSGLYRFHKKSGLFNPVGDSENAVENVYDILSDNHGSYWVSSDKGILKFDPYLKYNDSYFFGETMIGTKFNYGAASKDQNGWMYFGGDRVIIKFHPDSVQAVETKPFVYFSNFRLFGQDVAPDDSVNGRLVLDKNINYLDTLRLSYNQNDLTFVMQAINFSQPVFQDFRYRLVGFDNQWKRSIQGRAEATYTNLDFGEYMLRVETVAGQEASPYSTRQVFIVITPPWYQTTWFRLVFVLFVVGLVFLINYLRVRHLKMQKKMLSMQVDKKTMELRRSNELLKRQQIEVVSQKDEIEKQHAALKEMSERLQHALQSRLKLFTNISHEFRTPLTLLIGPLENIIYHKRKYPDMEVVYRLMYRNAKRLLELVNQLLDLRRIDSAKMKVKREKMDIVPFVNEVVQAFHDLADQKSIDLKFCADSASDFSFIDADKTEKILYNILSNAFKFTPDGGEISVCLNKEIHKNDRIRSSIPYYKIEISDTGTGIPAHHVEQIFDRFCHFEGNNSAPGSGIGLALTKELIEVLGGTIQVSSKPGEGTHFSVSLPVINNVEALEHGPIKKSRQKARAEKELELPRIELPDPFNQNPIIQIVEDDQDVLFYLVNELQPSFQILIARNGSEGVKLACQYIPDIIISDVMMPEMDGEHMTRIIKNNELTSHIPVVLLTAKDNEHGIIEGLESGAIDYITKPFNQKALRLKIDNILRNRQKLHYKIKCNKSSESLSGMDRASQDFLLQIDRLIEKNIQNPELNTDFFAKQMNCSKTTFYRKLKNLSGSSVNVYVRNKRIETAAILIKNNDKSVSEVAYDVGFNDPAYFSRCFKEYFKKSPRAYS